MKNNVKISIIVTTYNRSDALLLVLQSLAQQCGALEEVIIADDGSKQSHIDRLYQDLPAFNCSVKHVWHPDVGFTLTKVRNLGVAAASGDYLIFLDGDCVPNAHFIKRHRDLMEANCFVQGSRILLSPTFTARLLEYQNTVLLQKKSLFTWLRYRFNKSINKLFCLLGLKPCRAKIIEPLVRRMRLHKHFYWRSIKGCNMAFWRTDFIAVNGFDQAFSGWGHEDADFILRIHNLGRIRKNGFWATEVFHLWHHENKRDDEKSNRLRVEKRIKTTIIIAEQGFQDISLAKAARVTTLY